MVIRQKLIKKEISCYEACTTYYNNLTQEDVDFIVEKYPLTAVTHLNQYPFLAKKHVDYIIKEAPGYAAELLSHIIIE